MCWDHWRNINPNENELCKSLLKSPLDADGLCSNTLLRSWSEPSSSLVSAGLGSFPFSFYLSYLHWLVDPLWFHRVWFLWCPTGFLIGLIFIQSPLASFDWDDLKIWIRDQVFFMQMTCRFMWSSFLIILSLPLFYQFVLRTWRRRCHFFSWSIFNTPKTRILIIGFRHWLIYASSFSKSDAYGWLGQCRVHPFPAHHLWQSWIIHPDWFHHCSCTGCRPENCFGYLYPFNRKILDK